MDKLINKYLRELEKDNRKRFAIDTLELIIIYRYNGYTEYSENGGYVRFAKEINKLYDSNRIRPLKSSDYNGLNPPLKSKWELVLEGRPFNWDKSNMLQYSDCLDFTYYVNNPIYQTDLEWEYVENIYRFLKSRDTREWASLEERSLELFYDEKFLTERRETFKGNYGILKRLKLSYDALKMKKYGEMFIYWNRGTKNIKNVIILENHSTFFSYRKIAEEGKNIFGVDPDIIIYGEGNKIENSFSFIDEIAEPSKIKVLYFGDIDSEGFGIYARLKGRYPEVNINLQKDAYAHLIHLCNRNYIRISQSKKSQYLNCFLQDMEGCLDLDSIEKLKRIWDNNFRIPQELINYEYLLKVIR